VKIGRYRIEIGGKYHWFQTYAPTVIRRFWFLWILEEVDVNSYSAKKHFPLGTIAYCEGRRWYYFRNTTKSEDALRSSEMDEKGV
tara:strand:- start:444 stop:698 length:255 start_codon:yes stop_codon:yes gene_type:complete